jgi:crossover junction endodeoxyribonuclease RuvC
MGNVLRDLEAESRFEEKIQKYYCGIDPGFSGAIAIINDKHRVIECWDMPIHTVGKQKSIDIHRLKGMLTTYPLAHITIERAQAMPKQGVVSMFRYGESYGIIQGVCHMDVPRTYVRPADWKKLLMPGMDKAKGSSIVRAEELFNYSLPRKKDHGKAEAILIAEFGRRKQE